MGLFSIFKREKPETAAFMWEDDYCQVEIIPSSNYNFAAKQGTEINDFATKHFNGVGFTALYESENIPHPTAELAIPIVDFEEILLTNSFARIKKINYGGEQWVNYNKGITRAYGYQAFSFWADVKNQAIKNIWVTSYGEYKKELTAPITAIFNTLGKKYNLILADWNSCEIIDLTKIDEINTYLENY